MAESKGPSTVDLGKEGGGRKSRKRLHSIRVELAKKGGAIVSHSHRDKHGPRYDGDNEQYVFGDRKALMTHLHKHLGGGGAPMDADGDDDGDMA